MSFSTFVLWARLSPSSSSSQQRPDILPRSVSVDKLPRCKEDFSFYLLVSFLLFFSFPFSFFLSFLFHFFWKKAEKEFKSKRWVNHPIDVFCFPRFPKDRQFLLGLVFTNGNDWFLLIGMGHVPKMSLSSLEKPFVWQGISEMGKLGCLFCTRNTYGIRSSRTNEVPRLPQWRKFPFWIILHFAFVGGKYGQQSHLGSVFCFNWNEEPHSTGDSTMQQQELKLTNLLL